METKFTKYFLCCDDRCKKVSIHCADERALFVRSHRVCMSSCMWLPRVAPVIGTKAAAHAVPMRMTQVCVFVYVCILCDMKCM